METQNHHHTHKVDITFHGLDKILELFSHKQFSLIIQKLDQMAQELDDLTAKVEANGTVIGSAITLLQGLKAALDAAGTDPVKLKALSDSLGTQDQALADAIVANTPVE